MPKETLHVQPEETRFETSEGQWNQTSERMVRRMVLEAIVPLAAWAETKDPLTRQMVQATARRRGLYEQGNNWLAVLEEFCGKEIEILNLRNAIDLPKALAAGKNPATDRMIELGRAAESTLLACWHQNHGVLAATWPDTEDIPKSIQPLTRVVGPSINGEPAALWAWDRRNFPNPAI